MHIAIKKQQQYPIDTPNKNGTQQKRPPFLIPFEKICTLQKWHMINTPLEIAKYGTAQKDGALQKWHTLQKIFGHGILTSSFFPFQSDGTITIL